MNESEYVTIKTLFIIFVLVMWTLFVHDFYYKRGYEEGMKFEYKHDSPEDVIRAENMKLYNNSFELKINKKLKYVKLMDTNSMLPTFDYGHTLVEIECPCDLKAGDIVSFNYNNKSIVHRIISIDSQNGIHTRGDNAKYGEWINESVIVGKVIAVLY